MSGLKWKFQRTADSQQRLLKHHQVVSCPSSPRQRAVAFHGQDTGATGWNKGQCQIRSPVFQRETSERI
jgi:hypothetical protein